MIFQYNMTRLKIFVNSTNLCVFLTLFSIFLYC